MTLSMTDHRARSSNRITSALSIDRNRGVILTDPARKGLRLVPMSARRVWIYRYRAADGRLRQLKLGEYPTMSWKRAAQEWQKHKVERDSPSGGDPVAVIRAKGQAAKDRRLAERAAAYTVEELCADYIRYLDLGGDKGRVGGLKRSREIERMLNFDVLPALGRKQATAVRRADVRELIDGIRKRAPRIAAMVLQALKAAYERALDTEKVLMVNPCAGVKPPTAVRRDRALEERELRALFAWLPTAKLSQSNRDLIELELLTGARQGEICGMSWSEIDLDHGVWSLPGSRTKNGRPHTVFLAKQAIALLKTRREITIGRRWVFPNPTSDKSIDPHGIGWALVHVREDCPIAHFTCHDLRRSALTGLARLGCPRVVQDRIANHIDRSIGAIYDRHSYDCEAKDWWQRWANALDTLRPANNVVHLSRSA